MSLEHSDVAGAMHDPGLQFTGDRIDVDTDQATPADCGVQSIPTLVLLQDGHEVARLDGLIRDADLDQALDEHVASAGR